MSRNVLRVIAPLVLVVPWACDETNEDDGLDQMPGENEGPDDAPCNDADCGPAGTNEGGGTHCTGTRQPCDAYTGSELCGTIDGCSSVVSCQGNALPCAAMSEASCNAHLGCLWQFVTDGVDFCDGTAVDCSAMGDATCNSQSGCESVRQCTGQPLACESYATQTKCQEQPPCEWL